jgi:hypothetical protein
MNYFEIGAQKSADAWNKSGSDAKFQGMEKRTITIEGLPRNLNQLEAMLCFMEFLCGIGHSTEFTVWVDGDGSATLRFKDNESGKQLAKVRDNEERYLKLMDPDHDIKSFGFD